MLKIASMNLELTTACPLRCPQCYCSMDNMRHMELDTAKHYLAEAARNGVKSIALSGGETMCYPHLFEVIEQCKKYGFFTAAAFSGWHFTPDVVNRLIESGLDSISVSLNGSTEAINRLTRDGYSYSIHALELLREAGYGHTCLNWVMHSNNADDFPQILQLAEAYRVETVDIISFKPDSRNQMKSVPSGQQLHDVAARIRKYRGPVKIAVENCNSPLRALVGETALFGNLNLGVNKGCRAGLAVVSVSVDGLLAPCRHLSLCEKWDTLQEYWEKSPVLSRLRSAEEDTRKPCADCRYRENCRHCLAINQQVNGSIYIGNEFCALWKDP